MFPTKGQSFLEVFKHIHNASAQLDSGKVLEQQLKLGPALSIKSHLINQADIGVHQTDVNDCYVSEDNSNQEASYPFEHMEVMFSSMDISNCQEPASIQAFAVHQRHRNR